MSTLHPDVLRTLRADVGYGAADEFAGLFLASLPTRVDRLGTAVVVGDAQAAHVAALSLYSSAAMVGAADLAAAVREMIDPLRAGSLAPVRAAMADLVRHAQAVHSALAETLSTA